METDAIRNTLHGPSRLGLFCPERCVSVEAGAPAAAGSSPLSLPPGFSQRSGAGRGLLPAPFTRVPTPAHGTCGAAFVCTVLFTRPLGVLERTDFGAQREVSSRGACSPPHTPSREHLGLLGVEPGASFRGAPAQKTQLSPQLRPRIRFLGVLSERLGGIRFKDQHAKMPGCVIPHQGAT